MGWIKRKLEKEFFFVEGNLRVILISSILYGFGWQVRWYYQSILLRSLGGSPSQIGLLASVTSLIGLIAILPGAYYADNFGRAGVIKWFNFTEPLTLLFLGLATNWKVAAIGVIIYAIGAFERPPWEAIFDDSVPPEKRAMAYTTRRTLSSIITLGAPVLATYLIEKSGESEGIRLIFQIASVLSFVASVYMFFTLKETAETRKFTIDKMTELIRGSVESFTGINRYLSSNLKWLLMIFMITEFQMTIGQSFSAIYTTEIIGLTASQYSFLILIGNISGFIAAFPMTKLIEKVGNRTALIVSSAYALPSGIIWLFVKNFQVRIVLTVIGYATGATFSALMALRADMTPTEQRGRISGVTGLLGGLACIPAGAIAGILYEFNPIAPFTLNLTLRTVILGILWFKIRDPEKKEE